MQNFVFEHDNGNITDYNPIAYLYMNNIDGEITSSYNK